MAKNPWTLPDGFEDSLSEAIKAVLKALRASGKAIPKEALDALKTGDLQAFTALIDWATIPDSYNDFQQILADMAKNTATQMYRTANVGSELLFTMIDERAVQAAKVLAGKLITDITAQMRQTVNDLVTRSTAGEMTWQQLASKIRTILPLSNRDAEAAIKFGDKQYAKFVRGGLDPLTARAKAEAKAEKYAQKLMARRARTIARTELATAAGEGRYVGWESGIDAGMIDPQSVKEWIAEPTACEICHEMDGKTVPWDAEFEAAGVMMPPAHPNCRCSAAILPASYADSVFINNEWVGKAKIEPFEKALYKHLAGKHDQSTHGHGVKANNAMPVPKDKPVAQKYNLISATAPYVGLTGKAKAVAQRISPVISSNTGITAGSIYIPHDYETTTKTATYEAANGQKFNLEYKVISYNNKSTGKSESQDVRVFAYKDGEPNYIGDMMASRWDIFGTPYMTIMRINSQEQSNSALGTAMLEFARRETEVPIFHSSDLSEEGIDFARTTKSVEKHLAGKHDQSTHGHGGSGGEMHKFTEQEQLARMQKKFDEDYGALKTTKPEAYARLYDACVQTELQVTRYEKGNIVTNVAKSLNIPDAVVESVMNSAQSAWDKVPQKFKDQWKKDKYQVSIHPEGQNTPSGDVLASTSLGRPVTGVNPSMLYLWNEKPHSALGIIEDSHHSVSLTKTIGDWTMVHELGHAMDNFGNASARDNLFNKFSSGNNLGIYANSSSYEMYADVWAAKAFGAKSDIIDSYSKEFGWDK